MTTSQPRHPAFLSLQGGINFRDLGGQRAADGRRVRSGKLLRSGALNRLTAEDLDHLDTLPLSGCSTTATPVKYSARRTN